MSITPETFFKFAMEHNLNEIIRFHYKLRNGLKSDFAEVSSDPIAVSELERYDIYLSSNTFLMAYSYLEEYLYVIWKKRQKDEGRGRELSIKRYEPVLENLGVQTSNSCWQFLLKATKIRHCLLHANGRLSFMKKPQDIREIVSEFSPELTIRQGERLELQVSFLSRFINEVTILRDQIEPLT